jgi:acetyl-CoA C-acetyltransferase
MTNVVVVDAARSAVGRKGGSLGLVHPTDTLGEIMMKMLARNGLDSAKVDHVVGGCINKVGAQAMNVTRTAWLAHGGAEETACVTVDAQCGSSQQATTQAYHAIKSGMADVAIARF